MTLRLPERSRLVACVDQPELGDDNFHRSGLSTRMV